MSMTTEEQRLLIAVAEAVMNSAFWGQNTGITRKQGYEISEALTAFKQSLITKKDRE